MRSTAEAAGTDDTPKRGAILYKRDMASPRPKHEPPRGVLKAPDAPGRHRRYFPSDDLSPFVEHYWCADWDLSAEGPRTVQTLPHPCAYIVFERGRVAALSGVHRGRFVRELRDRGAVFSIKFKPGGFRPFWRAPLSALVDRTLPLRDAFSDARADAFARTTSEELLAMDDATRIASAEAFLRALDPKPDDDLALVSRIVRRILDERGLVGVDDVAAGSGVGLRRLQRLFRNYVGITPKWMIQRYRMHETLMRLDAAANADWAAFALDLGYCDQAHFIRDFKALVGTTPERYRRA